MNTRIKYQAYNLLFLTLVGFNVIAADKPTVSVESTSQPVVVQGRLDNPTANPITPSHPSIKKGYINNRRLVIDGHGGNMVTGETPDSRLTFKIDNTDYDVLKQHLNQQILPAKNLVQSQHLVNAFEYNFVQYEPLSKNYAMYTELAPSPYNADTLLLLIQIKLTDEVTDKAKFDFPYIQAHLRFNPRLISEYRLIGFEHDYSSNNESNEYSRNKSMPVNQYGQYTIFYELRQNEHDVQHHNDRFSASALAEMSLLDARSSQPLFSHVEIDMTQQGKFFEQASEGFRFAAAIAGLGQLINANHYVHQFDYNDVISIAVSAKGEDLQGQQEDFITVAKKAISVSSSQSKKLKPHQREPYPMPQPIYDNNPKTGYSIGHKDKPLPPNSGI